MKRIVRAAASLVLLASAAACGSESSTEIESIGGLLGAAAAHSVFVDNSFGSMDVFDRVSVVSVVGQPSDDGINVRLGPDDRALTADERASIVAALSPKPVTFVPAGTPPSADGEILEAIILFAEPSGGGSSAVVTTAMVCGGTCGRGGAQRFTLAESGWRFVENVGGQWAS